MPLRSNERLSTKSKARSTTSPTIAASSSTHARSNSGLSAQHQSRNNTLAKQIDGNNVPGLSHMPPSVAHPYSLQYLQPLYPHQSLTSAGGRYNVPGPSNLRATVAHSNSLPSLPPLYPRRGRKSAGVRNSVPGPSNLNATVAQPNSLPSLQALSPLPPPLQPRHGRKSADVRHSDPGPCNVNATVAQPDFSSLPPLYPRRGRRTAGLGSNVPGPCNQAATVAQPNSSSLPPVYPRGTRKSAVVGIGKSSHREKQPLGTRGKRNRTASTSGDEHGRRNVVDNLLTCPECRSQFRGRSKMKEHFVEGICAVKLFGFTEGGIECAHCQKNVDLRDRFKHVRDKHDARGRLYCRWCTYTTETEKNLKIHTRKHRTCPFCQKVLTCSGPEDLANHMQNCDQELVEEVIAARASYDALYS